MVYKYIIVMRKESLNYDVYVKITIKNYQNLGRYLRLKNSDFFSMNLIIDLVFRCSSQT